MKGKVVKKEQRKMKSDSTAPKATSEYQREKSSKSTGLNTIPKK